MGLIKTIQTKFEKVFVERMGWRHIPESKNQFIYLDIKRYKGSSLNVSKEWIKEGDIVAELHIDNINVAYLGDSIGALINGYNEEFKALVIACENREELREVKGFYCTTLLHPFIRRMGFTCYPIKNKIYSNAMKFWQMHLKNTFGKGDKKSKKRNIEPMTCWITKDTLKEKYIESL